VNRIERISVLLGDVALPLMGYFFWKWDLYFILLFFMLDQLSRVVLLHWRMKLTELANAEKTKLILQASVLLLVEIVLIHTLVFVHQNDIQFPHEFLNFLKYKDMGFAQGYILLPLIFVGEWMRINNELKMGIVGERQLKILHRSKINTFLRIGFFAIFIGIIALFPLPEWALVFSFLGMLTGLVFMPVK